VSAPECVVRPALPEDGGVKVDDHWDPPVHELRYVRPVPGPG
jgi:hypothetical protein